MSDTHIIEGGLQDKWKIVMHFPVPAGNNSVGLAWSTAIVNSGLNVPTILSIGDGNEGTITQAESDTIDAGTVFEHVIEILAETGGTSNAELKATLEGSYNSEKTRLTENLKRRLRYYSFTHDVP